MLIGLITFSFHPGALQSMRQMVRQAPGERLINMIRGAVLIQCIYQNLKSECMYLREKNVHTRKRHMSISCIMRERNVPKSV